MAPPLTPSAPLTAFHAAAARPTPTSVRYRMRNAKAPASSPDTLADDPENSEYTWMRNAHDTDIRQPTAARYAILAGAR
ncbi:hypothetical protein [Nocardia sp. CDC160]|uniref:hypothetical protein n=1 Tax=Nocardia sp. CDC160 TaxID=3112166 RepID=UPI002DBF36C6|nr:hypothetical protein [Nocardia sp. CDC160]MEC3913261.1 hypothetical protein [Nocardia sp. CDC160]